ncbi:ATP-binding protein [uncultured Shewanella sp.]|uniref:ATP-binding protein n=1 Tax=uncultured Shewanella sp. TaxID=173975 RepID=UPI002633398A|nr:ATP-binding protein [uncultured Shewanella sp.]
MVNLQINLDKSHIDQIQVSKKVNEFLKPHLNEQQKFKVVTCIMEVLANLIEHKDDSLKEIILIIHCDTSEIIIDILDDAHFTLLTIPDTCPSVNETSGRGLWILRQWMDSVSFQPTISGTHLRLTLNKE